MRTEEKKKSQVKMNDVITLLGDVVASTGCRVLYSSYSDNIIESSNCYASNLFYTKDIFEIIGVKGRHTVKTWYGDIILYTKVGTYS